MARRSFCILAMLIIGCWAGAAEEAILKLQPNTPLVYHSRLKMKAEQKTDTGLKSVGKGDIECSLIVAVDNNKQPYDFLITPKIFNFNMNLGGLTISYDTELALKTNFISREKLFIETIIDHTFRIPLTNNAEDQNPHDMYVINIFTAPNYDNEIHLKEILQAIDTGIKYTVGQREEFDLKRNEYWDKGRVVRTVKEINENEVVVKEELELMASSFFNHENPEDGGYIASGKGEFTKKIQRSNWLLMSCEGTMDIEISELNGHEGKQILNEGNLIIHIEGETTSSPANIEIKVNENPIVQQ